MTASSEVTLSMLDSSFRVTSADDRMVDLVRLLWEPFLSDAEDVHDVALEVEGEGWRLHVAGEPPNRATDPWVVVSSLRNALSRRAIADARSLVPVHAAAVERDGRFLVLSGPAQAGKTTLLLELLDHGWLLVTDDLVPVDPATLTATPFPKPLSVRDPARWRRFARRWRVPAWLPQPSVGALIPATAMPLTAATSYRPSLLVFSRYSPGEPPSQERLTRAHTVAW
ncbi:MAG: hypothetical protein M3279_06670, partial [Actinomycetota bacterium]|nr:hypothetical protein [Actinomycetota bacterium]